MESRIIGKKLIMPKRRFTLELWMEKTGREGQLPPVDPQDDSSPMYWGTLLEPIVAAHYTRRTGHRVRRINAVLQHSDHPWMLANIDREVVGAPDVQILECKTAGIWCTPVARWRAGVRAAAGHAPAGGDGQGCCRCGRAPRRGRSCRCSGSSAMKR